MPKSISSCTMQRYLERAPKREDVLSAFAGIRPLRLSDKKTSELARDHVVRRAIGDDFRVGWEVTTYRKMAADVMRKIESHSSASIRFADTECSNGGSGNAQGCLDRRDDR